MGKGLEKQVAIKEKRTIIHFIDGDNELVRTYPELIDFKEGETITLFPEGSQELSILRGGTYIIEARNNNRVDWAICLRNKKDYFDKHYVAKRKERF